MIGHPSYPSDAWDIFSSQFSEQRRLKMETTVQRRTNHIRLIIQDVHQHHNVSACIRSAEGFGIQNIDVVTLGKKFTTSTVAKGVDHWLSISRYQSIEEAVRQIKAKGYLIAAAYPKQNAVPLQKVPVDRPIAVAFGNEHAGLDSKWMEAADICFTIPMVGMVESFNISVSAAITLYDLSSRSSQSLPPSQYYLSPEEQNKLLCEWACRQTPHWSKQLEILRASRT